MQRQESPAKLKGWGAWSFSKGFLPLILCLFSFSDSLLLAQSPDSALAEPKQPFLRFELSVPSMGSHVDFVVYARSESQAKLVMDAGLSEIASLSALLSNYDSNSEISRLCSAPTNHWTPVSRDLSTVLMHSHRWFQLSDGKFDITVGPLTELWRTGRQRQRIPTQEEIVDAKQRCGWAFVELDSGLIGAESNQPIAVSLLKPKMKLDLSGLAVGYIVDRAFEKMTASGSRSILVNAGGDIRVGDPPPGMDGWRITIAGLGKVSPPLAMLRVKNCAVTTSGDLNQFVEFDGHRYSHFIDPESGDPIERRQSVTAIAATTLDADAGATAFAVLGMNRASALFENLPLSEAIFVEAGPDDSIPMRTRWLTKD